MPLSTSINIPNSPPNRRENIELHQLEHNSHIMSEIESTPLVAGSDETKGTSQALFIASYLLLKERCVQTITSFVI